jgi:hypothetical protein
MSTRQPRTTIGDPPLATRAAHRVIGELNVRIADYCGTDGPRARI